MTVTWIVLLVAGLAALAVFASSAVRALPDPIDPGAEERAAVRWFDHHPRLQRFLRQRFDRRTAGGLLLTVSLLVTFAVALAVGILLDMVDETSGLAELDNDVAEWGAAHASVAAVDVLKVITHLGGTWVLVAALAATATIDLVRHHNVEVVVFLGTVLAGEKLIVNGLKELVDRERPDVMPLVSFSGASFPSGHAAAAAAVWPAVALVLSRGRRRVFRALLAGGAALIAGAVAASRAVLGVHWLTDVIAGLAIGWGWFVVVAVVFGGWAQRLGDPVTAQPQGLTRPGHRQRETAA